MTISCLVLDHELQFGQDREQILKIKRIKIDFSVRKDIFQKSKLFVSFKIIRIKFSFQDYRI